MQTMTLEIKDFSDSIVLFFPGDILRKNNMDHMLLQQNRELLYSSHMYSHILLLLNQPHHFQSKSVSFNSTKIYSF